MYNGDDTPAAGTGKSREKIYKNMCPIVQPFYAGSVAYVNDNVTTALTPEGYSEIMFPYQYSTDYTLDIDYDIPGVYSETTGNRTSGQSP